MSQGFFAPSSLKMTWLRKSCITHSPLVGVIIRLPAIIPSHQLINPTRTLTSPAVFKVA